MLQCVATESHAISSNSCKTIKLSEGSTTSASSITIARAAGTNLWDVNGKKYLDLFSQTWSMPLGHNHPKIIEAARNQLENITHLRTAYSTERKLELANLLVKYAPEGLTKVNFVLHGSLAVEGAMKQAINNYSDRDKIIFLEDGFHGRSLAAMGVSWKIPDCKFNNFFHHGIEAKKDLKDIETKIVRHKPAAIIMELVQGNSGCRILDKDFAIGVRRLCDKYNVVMIVDEIQTAFGCVEELFLCGKYGLVPDILLFGKAIGGGFPLAGSLSKEKFFLRPGDHSFTFGHSPISFATAVAFLQEIQHHTKAVSALSSGILEGLTHLQGKYRFLQNARCIGTKGAVDVLDMDGNPDGKLAGIIVARMQERGIIISASRYRDLGNTLMLQTPLILKLEELRMAFAEWDSVLENIDNPTRRAA